MDETPRSPDSGQIAFQKRIQDTLISTAERQLESFRNQNHLQFRNIQNFLTVDGTLKNKIYPYRQGVAHLSLQNGLFIFPILKEPK